jgi:hypothetical protein
MKKQDLKSIAIFLLAIVLGACQSDNSITISDNTISNAFGWKNRGSKPKSYEMGIEKGCGQKGNNAATIKSIDPAINGFGTLMQTCLPGKFSGKRVRLSGFIKSKDVEGWAGLWLRIDPKLGFDNMKNGKNDVSITGTTAWKKYEVVLDVPAETESMSYGVLLFGTGQVWFENISFEIVDNSVPVTGMEINAGEINKEPVNLLFDKTKEKIFTADVKDLYKAESWFNAGNKPTSYLMGIQEGAGQEGRNAATLKSTEEHINGFGTFMQDCLPEKYLGKKIKMSGYMKSQDVTDWAGFWLRVDKESSNVPLSFDNMEDRAVKGTTAWKKYEITLDVPANASNIAYGALLSGTGQIWFENITFEIVGDADKVKDDKKTVDKMEERKIEAEPVNLNFEKVETTPAVQK